MTRPWRRRPAVLAALAALILSGCDSPDEASSTEAPPFVFRSLELRQKRPNGKRDWDLTSPEARYEFSRRLVRASRPEGLLYRDNQPAYRIRADRATVVNDGQLVLLEGNVQLQQLQGQKVLIKGDRLRWTPPQALLVMEQRPEAIDRLTRIQSQLAQLHQRSQDLTLLGTVQLERWIQTPGLQQGRHADSVVRVRQTRWNLGTGALEADGPVLGQRRGKDHQTLQQLHAKRLSGNTAKGFLDLIGPVKVVAPKRDGRLEATTPRWLFEEDALVSDHPFKAFMNDSRLSGQAFRIAMGQTTVTVINGCQLTQPGDQLKASRCAWNWSTNRVQAQGNVELQRKANQQITRSDRLEGSVGRNGTVVFTSPGGSVQSQLKIKDNSNRSQSRGKDRSTPVSF